jgi:hypothetical protein
MHGWVLLTMNYLLRNTLNNDDIDFLNDTNIIFEIVNTHGLAPETTYDSGWRDAATNARIIGVNDRAVFKEVTSEDYVFLHLRYHDRLLELTDGIKDIYNVNMKS